MPIFTYVAVVSLGLIALLFVLDGTLEKGVQPIITPSAKVYLSLGVPTRHKS